MRLPLRLRPWLRALVARGLHGATEDEVAVRLVEDGLRRLVEEEYLRKADNARTYLRTEGEKKK